jgi:hypothetical protein
VIIAFCTSCMDRTWQLEQTLRDNLAVLSNTRHFIALCDFNSSDDLSGLVRSCSQFVDSGTLSYFRTLEPETFHMSIAKNTAHRLGLLGQATILFNLDADNRINAETVKVVESAFQDAPDTCLHNWDLHVTSGTCGRIGLAADRWVELGGYDEALLPIGWQDLDLLIRARGIGLRYLREQRGIDDPVRNTFEEKLENVRMPPEMAELDGRSVFNAFATRNMIASLSRPLRLDAALQRRFSGVLNFQQNTLL